MKETPVTFSTHLWHKLCFLPLMVLLCPLQSIRLVGPLGTQSHLFSYGLLLRTKNCAGNAVSDQTVLQQCSCMKFLGSSLAVETRLWDRWLVSWRSEKLLFCSGFPEWLQDPSSHVSGEYCDIFPRRVKLLGFWRWTTHLHLMIRLRLCGAVLSVLHLWLYLSVKNNNNQPLALVSVCYRGEI